MEKEQKTILAFVLCLVAICVAIAVVVGGGWAMYGQWQGRRAESWPTTAGTIAASKIVEEEVRARRARGTISHAEITYRYRVDGRDYTSDRIRFAVNPTRDDARLYVERFPARSEVDVYYNPNKPSEAVLEAGHPVSTLVTALSLVGILIVCGVAFVIGQRLSRT